ncbi:MAG TPA: PCRF domain-containing protein, partial [Rubrobacteraceae bacterium]|nr:PCRF domain-containing protein [Rubrobacteraceae bacterium]
MSELRERISGLEGRLSELEDFFNLETLKGRADELAKEMSRPGFWEDPEEAKKVSAEFSRVEERVRMLDALRTRLVDAGELLELSEG